VSGRAGGCAALVLALAIASARAQAGTLLDVTAGGTVSGRPHGDAGAGFGIGADFAAQSWLSFQVRLDGTQRGHESPVSFTLGPRLGSNHGAVRPYLDLALGLSGGANDAGVVAGYGAGVVADMPGSFALVAFARSINMGNMEYSGHQAEYRAGIAFRIGRTRE